MIPMQLSSKLALSISGPCSKPSSRRWSSKRMTTRRGLEGISNTYPRRTTTTPTQAYFSGFDRVDSMNIHVNWRNYNLQILFIDRTDTIRSRLAVGMFERICHWNGLTLSLIAYPCGLEPIVNPNGSGNESYIEFHKQAALMSYAEREWKFRPRIFTSPRQQFDVDDIDRFNLLVAMDDSIQAEVLKQISEDRPSEPASYIQRVCCLSDFAHYVDDERLLQSGGSGLLDRELRERLRANLSNLRPSLTSELSWAAKPQSHTDDGINDDVDVSHLVSGIGYVPSYLKPSVPRLTLEDPPEEWDRTVLLMGLLLAGLTEFLLDSRPVEYFYRGYDTDA